MDDFKDINKLDLEELAKTDKSYVDACNQQFFDIGAFVAEIKKKIEN